MATTLRNLVLLISVIFIRKTSAVPSTQCSETQVLLAMQINLHDFINNTLLQNSYLWKVEVNPPVYLFGTLHLPYNNIWDTIPDNVKTAFSSSSDVFLELEISDQQTSMSLMECQLLPGDCEITSLLHESLVKRIENYLRRILLQLPNWLDDNSRSTLLRGGQSASDDFFADVTRNWRRKRPIWVLTLISSLTEENVKTWTKPVLDHFLDNAAGSLGKNLTALETPNEHCQPLNRLEDAQASCKTRFEQYYGVVKKFKTQG